MRPVNRDEKFAPLVKQLTEINLEDTGRPIFPSIRRLLCFAALVGFHFQNKKPLGSKRKQLPFRLFEGKDEYIDIIFCLALMENKKPQDLSEENDDEILKNFEELTNGGLEIIQKWLDEYPSDKYGHQAILEGFMKNKMLVTQKSKKIEIEDVNFL